MVPKPHVLRAREHPAVAEHVQQVDERRVDVGGVFRHRGMQRVRLQFLGGDQAAAAIS
jgi:hypothetical protein